ncbi:hypothetical protein IL306_006821, partial [Fusarium sp. DS 682]
PAAWIASNTKDLAIGVNNRLIGGPPVAHGITPHPYAFRENLTVDLESIAQASLPMRDPATFANEYPREIVEDHGSPSVGGPLGDITQAWEQQFQLGQNSPPAVIGSIPVVQTARAPTRRDSTDLDMADISSHGARATVLSDFEYSSSETDVSDDDAQWTRESSSSGTTLVEFSDAEEELLSKISSFERSEAIEKGYDLKRKSSWVPLYSKKKKKMEDPKARKRGSGLEPKKAKSKVLRRRKERNLLGGMPSRTFAGRVSGPN